MSSFHLKRSIKKFLNQVAEMPVQARKVTLSIIDLILIIVSVLFSNFLFHKNLITDNTNIEILLFSIIAIPLFYFTGQYKGLTKYLNPKSLYKILIRNIFVFTSTPPKEVLGLDHHRATAATSSPSVIRSQFAYSSKCLASL